MTIFDWVNQILVYKKPWDSFTVEEQKKFSPFIINRFLSMDKELIVEKMLTKNEKKYLFNYHLETYFKISPFLNKKQKKWLGGLI